MNKSIHKSCFQEFKRQASLISTEQELVRLEKSFYKFSEYFGAYKSTIEKFLTLKKKEFKELRLNNLIKPFEEEEAIKFNLIGLDEAEKKIRQIKNPKLRFEFEGLFNLLSDHKNLTYNDLKVRQEILDMLNKFKSLRYFKVSYISRYDLKKEYRYLSYKNGAVKNHSKVIPINKNLLVLKTVEQDDLTLKVFYTFNSVKELLKKGEIKKTLPIDGKFNLSSVNAWKILDKEDNIIFYSYCNANGLHKTNRQLLKSIRREYKPQDFISLVEDAEIKIHELEAKITSYYESEEEIFPVSDLVHYEWELKETEEFMSSIGQEDNALSSLSELGDYLW